MQLDLDLVVTILDIDQQPVLRAGVVEDIGSMISSALTKTPIHSGLSSVWIVLFPDPFGPASTRSLGWAEMLVLAVG